MGLRFSKNYKLNRDKPGFSFRVINKDEMLVLKKLGYLNHPDLSCRDIIFIKNTTTSVFSTDFTNYYQLIDGNTERWRKSDIKIPPKPGRLEDYAYHFCEKVEIDLKGTGKKEEVWVYKS